MTRIFRRLVGDINGATAVEYGLILALIFVVSIVALTGVATKTNGLWNTISNATNRT